MTVGQRIAQKRKDRGFSQEALGEALGVSRQSVYKWESGSALPEIDKLIAMSRLFGVTVGWLLGVEESCPDETEKAVPRPDGGDAPEELTDIQLKMVEEIVDRYLAAQTPVRRRRWPWVLAGVALAAGLLLLRSEFRSELWTMQARYDSLQTTISGVTRSVNDQIEGIAGRVEEALKSQNNLTADYGAEIASADLAANTVTFRVHAVPKTYTEGMTAVFTADSGADAAEVPAKLGAGQEFSALVTCALTDEITISVTFAAGDVRETQLLDSQYGLYMRSLPEELEVPEASGALWGKGLDREGKLTWPGEDGYAFIPRSSSVAAADAALMPAQARSLRVGLFRNQKLLGWLEPCERPDSYKNGFQNSDFYRFPEISVEPEVGDRFRLCAIVEDEYGREFLCRGIPYIWDGEYSAMQIEGGEAGLDDPANWEY